MTLALIVMMEIDQAGNGIMDEQEKFKRYYQALADANHGKGLKQWWHWITRYRITAEQSDRWPRASEGRSELTKLEDLDYIIARQKAGLQSISLGGKPAREVRLAEKATLERNARLTRRLIWCQSSYEMWALEAGVDTETWSVTGAGGAPITDQGASLHPAY